MTDILYPAAKILAANRDEESYFCGGITIGRPPRDIDILSITPDKHTASVIRDTATLKAQGFALNGKIWNAALMTKEIRKDGECVEIDWINDPGKRFFLPLRHRDLGFVAHPFDTACKKFLMTLKMRDYQDIVDLAKGRFPLTALFIACGKPGLNLSHVLDLYDGNRRGWDDLLKSGHPLKKTVFDPIEEALLPLRHGRISTELAGCVAIDTNGEIVVPTATDKTMTVYGSQNIGAYTRSPTRPGLTPPPGAPRMATDPL